MAGILSDLFAVHAVLLLSFFLGSRAPSTQQKNPECVEPGVPTPFFLVRGREGCPLCSDSTFPTEGTGGGLPSPFPSLCLPCRREAWVHSSRQAANRPTVTSTSWGPWGRVKRGGGSVDWLCPVRPAQLAQPSSRSYGGKRGGELSHESKAFDLAVPAVCGRLAGCGPAPSAAMLGQLCNTVPCWPLPVALQ